MRPKLAPLLHLLIVVVSIGLLLYGYMRWSVDRRFQQAQRLHAEGSLEEALRAYEDIGRDLGENRWKGVLFEQHRLAAQPPQLALLYELRRYDQAVELADALIQAREGDLAAYYFWSGTALFQKGMTEDADEDSFRWFNRSIAQLRKAMEEDRSARWGIRYNYELIKTSVEEVMAAPEQDRAKILRQQETKQSSQPRKIEG